MGLVYIVLGFYVLVFLVLTFWVCFSDVDDQGLLGSVSRTLFRDFPNYVKSVLVNVFGKGYVRYFEDWLDYFQNRRNPVCQITYLLILDGAYISWLIVGQPLLPVMFVGTEHVYIAFIGVLICHHTFYLACSVEPGKITEQNLSAYMHRPYDGIIYCEDRYADCESDIISTSRGR